MVEPRSIFPFFFIWAILGLGSFLFFAKSKDVSLKKRVFPRIAIGAGVLLWLVIAASAPWQVLLFFTPFLGAVTWLNIRMTRFCDACGTILINHQWWSQMKFCPYCGAKLPER